LNRLAAAALAMAALVVGAMLSLQSAAATASDRVGPAQQIPDPRQVFLSDCAVCHGAGGTGTSRGPSLIDVGAASVDYMLTTGRMPIHDPGDELRRRPSPYSAELQRALVDYIGRLAGGGGPAVPAVDPGAGDVARGGELFRLQCAACHAWSGEGGALYQREAPPLQPATATQLAEAVRTGPGTMPVFGAAAIDDSQLDDLAAFSEQLKRPDDRGGQPLGHVGPVAEGAVGIVLGLGTLLVATRWIGKQR
jgi:ubiquinol-cytochrome c reductase cytochrome c subunit